MSLSHPNSWRARSVVPVHDLAKDLESEVLVHRNDPWANRRRPPLRLQRAQIIQRDGRAALPGLAQVPAGRGVDADLVDTQRERLTQQLVVVAWPAAAIPNGEDRLVTDRLT